VLRKPHRSRENTVVKITLESLLEKSWNRMNICGHECGSGTVNGKQNWLSSQFWQQSFCSNLVGSLTED
jgi:hypothetical protein